MLRILFLGDIFGEPGRKGVKTVVPQLREKHRLDLVIANCENAAQGRGITVKMVNELKGSSIDFLTSGNHIWHCKEIFSYLNTPDCCLIRPANMPSEAPGKGAGIVETAGGVSVAIFNVMGRVFMSPHVDCPFKAFDSLLDAYQEKADLILLDMHAETTSEKRAMGWHVDGKVQACVGTHTHVQTADEEILPRGTAYISDLGMTGPYDSVIGMAKEGVIRRFRTSLPTKFEVGSNDVRVCGAVIEIDEKVKKATSIIRICEKVETR